jgi:hypothetical protein
VAPAAQRISCCRTPASNTIVHKIETELTVINKGRVMGEGNADVRMEGRPRNDVKNGMMRNSKLVAGSKQRTATGYLRRLQAYFGN